MTRLVYGVNPVKELLAARGREVSVVYLAAGDTGAALAEIARLARGRQITVEQRERHELDALAGAEARHQGAIAIAGEFVYAELEDILLGLPQEAPAGPPLVVVLDGVQDPHNLGAIVRSAHVLGAHAVVVPKDRAAPITAAAVKASAGATEHLPIVRVTNLVRALSELKEAGLWIVGTVARSATRPWAVDLRGPIALVVGAEGPGLRPLVQKTCDFLVEIPMSGRVASLNVSVAAGALLYEAARQRCSGATP